MKYIKIFYLFGLLFLLSCTTLTYTYLSQNNSKSVSQLFLYSLKKGDTNRARQTIDHELFSQNQIKYIAQLVDSEKLGRYVLKIYDHIAPENKEAIIQFQLNILKDILSENADSKADKIKNHQINPNQNQVKEENKIRYKGMETHYLTKEKANVEIKLESDSEKNNYHFSLTTQKIDGNWKIVGFTLPPETLDSLRKELLKNITFW